MLCRCIIYAKNTVVKRISRSVYQLAGFGLLGYSSQHHGSPTERRMETLAFCNGFLFFYTHSIYSLVGMLLALYLKAPKQIVFWFGAACCWALVHQYLIADQGMPDAAVIPKAHVAGEIVSIPDTTEAKIQFQFLIHRFNHHDAHAKALLSCYQHCPSFKTGEFWQFDVKLKKPINLANPGSFDYAGKLAANHVFWTGYLRGGVYQKEAKPWQRGFHLNSFREQLAAQIEAAMPNAPGSGIVQAISLGITHHLTQAQWDLFRRTGTTHLMVISGAHVGLVAGFCYVLMDWLWRRSRRLCLWWPSQQVASIVGFLGALSYVLLAGSAIPAQRALIACGVLLSRNVLSWRFTGWQAWRYGLCLVLCFEPHAVVLPGFYLSFLAVAILIVMSRRFVNKRGLGQLFLLQLSCLIGLMPLTLYWFSYSALNGFFANLLAIPLVGYVIVPLSLVALLLLHSCSMTWLFVPLKSLCDLLLAYLHWVDLTAGMNLEFSLSTVIAMLALLLALGLAIFLPLKAVWPAMFVMVMSVLCPYYVRPKFGEAIIDVLDVGQGLSVLIQTTSHQLLYDTGVQFYKGSDMGKLVILPFLQNQGLHHLDKVVISHPDLDHRGGLRSLNQKIKFDVLLVNDLKFYANDFAGRGHNCHDYPDWEWDGVKFHFLPIKAHFDKVNNTCCVLKVTTRASSVLLVGDIEKLAEAYLIQNDQQALASDVLIVPHHGSKTSSSLAFIHAVAPEYALISAGFDNRYHFPHQATLTTLANAGIQTMSTMTCGMVSVKLPALASQQLARPACFLKSQF